MGGNAVANRTSGTNVPFENLTVVGFLTKGMLLYISVVTRNCL